MAYSTEEVNPRVAISTLIQLNFFSKLIEIDYWKKNILPFINILGYVEFSLTQLDARITLVYITWLYDQEVGDEVNANQVFDFFSEDILAQTDP